MVSMAVQFQGVSKRYGASLAVRNLDLSIGQGQIVTLIGPSGCGKTTSLKMINRLIEPDEGLIEVDGQNVRSVNAVELRRKIGYVIQQIGLFPHMTIEENIALVPRLTGQKVKSMRHRTDELLDLIGLDPVRYRGRYPKELSGGQQQRIGVARALAADPSIILMDEPFSALDPISREQLQDELVKLQAAVHKTIIFVTHDMDEALKIADEIVLMKDGHVVQAASPEMILRHPSDAFVRDFVGEKRFAKVAAQTNVRDLMTQAVTVKASTGLAQAIERMQRHRVNALLVTDGHNGYLGVLSPQQIYQHFGDETKQVADVFTKDVPVVHPENDIIEVFQHLQRSQHGFVPVLDASGRLLGVVTRASVINVMSSPYQKEDVIGELTLADPIAK